jgi:hypothetical protein
MSCQTTAIIIIAVFLALLIGLILWFVLGLKPKPIPTGSLGGPDIVGAIQFGLQKLVETLSKNNVSIDTGCSGSNVNILNFCNDKVKASGSLDIGGSAACSIPYQSCKAACTVACGACRVVPFVGCGKPCDDCPKACQAVYDACSNQTRVEWSVNVLEVGDLANTMTILPLDSFSARTRQGKHILSAKIPVTLKPYANIDVRTTGTVGNYQGRVGFGNLKFVVGMEFLYDCATKQATLRNMDPIQISGMNLDFAFANSFVGALKNALYSLAKSKIESAVTDVLQDKLTSLFQSWIQSELLPQLQPVIYAFANGKLCPPS